MKTKYKHIAMCSGYVEEATVSWLIYDCLFHDHPGFDNMGDAIKELALDLYSKYCDDNKNLLQCCLQAKGANYCPKCGTFLDYQNNITDCFPQYVKELHFKTTDSYGAAEDTSDRIFVWWPYGMNEFVKAKKSSIIWIPECAEQVLLCALSEANPELNIGQGMHSTYSIGSGYWEQFKNNKQPELR